MIRLCLLMTVLFNFCAAFANSEKLVITGASTIAPLVSEIAKRFERIHKNVRVDVQTGGSSRGVADTQTGMAHIGMVSRELKDAEKAELKHFTVALDGVSLIVHRDNPIQELTDSQIVDIFTGRVRNWKDVGGHDAPITVVNKAEGRSTLELFLNHFNLKGSQIRPHMIIGDNEQGIKTVAGNLNAIGYVSIGTAEYSVTNSVPIKLLPLKGIAATVENVRKGTFKLARPLNLVTKGAPDPLEQKFIEFALSKEVQDLVEQQYFVSTAK